jgi:hypothetical protein
MELAQSIGCGEETFKANANEFPKQNNFNVTYNAVIAVNNPIVDGIEPVNPTPAKVLHNNRSALCVGDGTTTAARIRERYYKNPTLPA